MGPGIGVGVGVGDGRVGAVLCSGMKWRQGGEGCWLTEREFGKLWI